MYSVKYLGQNLEKIKPIYAGVSFGFLEKPIYFEIKADVVKNPLLVSFLVDIQEKCDKRFEIGGVVDNTLPLMFHLPNKNSIAGLSTPISFIQNEGYAFAIMFEIEAKGERKTYKITYEMYEGRL